MSRLTLYADGDATTPDRVVEEPALLRDVLASFGVRYARLDALPDLPRGAAAEAVLAAYAPFIAAESAERGYRTADVAAIPRGAPGGAAMRAKFLSEHTHAEDESRLFTEGSGSFYLHLGGKVLVVRCERGDYLSVPAGTRHWFDMGADPCFTAIRLFTDPAGWVAAFTGDALAERFPGHA